MCRHNQGTEALAETGDKIEGPGWTVTEELDAMKNFTQLAEQRVHLQAVRARSCLPIRSSIAE